MQIAQLKAKIEAESHALIETNSFLRKSRTQGLSATEKIEVPFQSHEYSRRLLADLRRAADASRSRGIPVLASFMDRKVVEESGHDAWARADRKSQGLELADYMTVSPEADELMNFISELASTDPRLYLGYVSFVEYFTVHPAPSFLAALAEKNQVPRSAMSVVANHEEADREHIEEDLAIFSQLDLHHAAQGKVTQVISDSARKVDRFLNSSLQSPRC